MLTQSTPAEKRDNLCEILGVLKQVDFNVAVDIAAHGNQKLRDKFDNILKDIWSRNACDADAATGQLTSYEDIQTYMRQMLKENFDKNKELLVQCDNDTLCSWILNFVTSWEKKYRGIPNKYDISENILSVMSEAVQYVTPHFRDTPYDVEALEEKYRKDVYPRRAELPFLFLDAAVVRFYFRNPSIARYMVLIAGKLLQKRECNRSGVYCSVKQRHDVARELDRVVSDLKFKLRSLDRSHNNVANHLVVLALDHKKMECYCVEESTGTTPPAATAAQTTTVLRAAPP